MRYSRNRRENSKLCCGPYEKFKLFTPWWLENRGYTPPEAKAFMMVGSVRLYLIWVDI